MFEDMVDDPEEFVVRSDEARKIKEDATYPVELGCHPPLEVPIEDPFSKRIHSKTAFGGDSESARSS